MFGRSNKNQNNHSKTNGYNGHRTRSNVLAQLPIWTIIFFYMRAVPVACYVIIKWLVQFIWKTLRQSPDSKRDGNDMRHIDYYDGAHDKPPPCLVDNRIGLQSYVKLKVYIISIALLLWSSTIGKTRPKTHRHSKEEEQKKKNYDWLWCVMIKWLCELIEILCKYFRVQNCTLSRPATMRIHLCCFCMAFPTVGLAGIIKWELFGDLWKFIFIFICYLQQRSHFVLFSIRLDKGAVTIFSCCRRGSQGVQRFRQTTMAQRLHTRENLQRTVAIHSIVGREFGNDHRTWFGRSHRVNMRDKFTTTT